MRNFIALAFVFAAACGGSQAPSTSTPGPGSDTAAETCCCKSTPLASEDAKPVYEQGNRIECSSKQGTCVDDVQCEASEAGKTESTDTGVPPPPEL
ncbi:MAG: hypothetical protein AB7R00_05700 [Kofleriaceae bacterium]